MGSVAVGDERRHRAGPERWWGESWDFDFAAPDGSLGGYVRLGLHPTLGVAWFWAALVGRGRRLVIVRDHDIELPRGGALEVRGQGLWSAVTCETPLDHWSIGLEAFAVALDDPAEAFRSGWGDRVGIGFDLEWESAADAYAAGAGHYEQSCRVHGEILVGDEQLAFGGAGQRRHRWGVDDWWARPWRQVSGTLAGAAAFWARTGDDAGYLASEDGLVPVDAVGLEVALDGDGLPLEGAARVGPLSVAITPVAHAPLVLDAPDGRRSHLARTLCRYQASDGRAGAGWLDCLAPLSDRFGVS